MLKKMLQMIAMTMAIVILMSGCVPSTHVETVNPPSQEVTEEVNSTEATTEVEETTGGTEETEAVTETNGEDDEPASSASGEDVEGSKSEPTSEPVTTENKTSKPSETSEPEQPAETTTPVTEQTDVQTSTVTVSGTYNYAEAQKTLELVNNYRKEHGLGELTWDESLAPAAKTRAAEASICWSHTRPNGSAWYTVSNLVKGENLAKGYSTAEEAFNAWLASEGHRENILWKEFNTMYVAFFEAENGWFWAQEFGY